MSSSSVEQERSSAENVTIIAETFGDPGATVSSIKSEDSTEQLICKTPQRKPSKKVDTESATVDRSYEDKEKSVASLSVVEEPRSRVVLWLGLGQLVVGVCMLVLGGLVIVQRASLARVGAGLWAGCIAVATGVVGVLAGINDCYGLYGARRGRSGAFLTAFLALSLASLAAGNMAAVLAGAGVYRDTHNNRMPTELDVDLEEEKEAWMPVLTNIGLVIASTLHCLLAVVSIYHASRRVCPCLRAKEPFNHNTFDPSYTSIRPPYVVHVQKEVKKQPSPERAKNHQLCKDLEKKLEDNLKEGRKVSAGETRYDSASSRSRLVSHWLGRHPPRRLHAGRAPVLLVPQPVASHAASTLGRPVPVPVMAVGGRFHTLPLPPHPAPPPHFLPHPVYYPIHEVRTRRRRSPRSATGGVGAERRARGRPTRSQLTRSLERIHRRGRDKQPSDADLKRTYTGLDRAIAEQFIQVCDETRAQPEKDSSGPDTASSECHSNRF